MPFRDYSEFAKPPIVLPVNGKTYTLPPIGAQLGILLLSAINGDRHATQTLGTSMSLWRQVLGPVYDEMLADNVPLDVVARAGFTAMADFQYDRATAERVWESELNPEAAAALAAATREPRKASQQSPSTAAASKTPSPASTTGTTSPTGSPRKARPSRSNGSRSSRSKP